MNIGKKYIVFFEIIIISLILLFLIQHESDTRILQRSSFFEKYSKNFLYFVLAYFFCYILFYFKQIRDKVRFLIITLNSIYSVNFFKNNPLETNVFNKDEIIIVLIFLFFLPFFFYNYKYFWNKILLIKNYNYKKTIIKILKLNIKDIFIYLGIVLIIIFILEVFLNLFLPKNFTNIISDKRYGNYFYNFPYRHEHYQFIGKGNASMVKTEYRHITRSGKSYLIKYSTNNKGFRIPFDINISEKLKKQYNEKVIILIGGSTALGVGSSDNGTIASILENKLKNNFPNYKFTVLNFGIGAGNTYQEFLVLDLYGNNFEPDWVISLTGRNDGYNALITNSGAGTTNGFLKTKKIVDGLYYNQPIPKLHFSNIANFFSKYSVLYRIATSSSHIKTKEKKSIKFEETFKTINFYLKSIYNIISYDNDIKYIISNQPYYDLIVNNNFNKIEDLTEFENKNKNKFYEDIDKLLWMEYWNAKSSLETKNFLKNKINIFYNNFNKDFSKLKNLEDIFIDSTHLTKDGNEIIAQKYFDIISKNLE